MAEQLRHHGLEKLQWQRVIFGVERWAVIFVDEFFGVRKPFMTAELFAHVTIKPKMVEKIVALENAVVLNNPVKLFGDERL